MPVHKLAIQHRLFDAPVPLARGSKRGAGTWGAQLVCDHTAPGTESGRSLVNTRISQNPAATAQAFLRSAPSGNFQLKFEIYRHDVRVLRVRRGHVPSFGGGRRGEIDGFSAASRRRLKRVASDARSDLLSQFCLTYHQINPDSTTAKSHLNSWLTWLRGVLADSGTKLKYLWVMEFQKRGVLHYHIFVNIPAAPLSELHLKMAKAWTRITKEGSEHTKFHANAKNWIDWNMGTGSYLCKYLDKQAQKAVPEDFGTTGRFWGASRGLMCEPAVLNPHQMAEMCASDTHGILGKVARETHHKDVTATVLRTLSRYQKSVHRRYGRSSKPLTQHVTSSWVAGGAAVFTRQLEYMISNGAGPPGDDGKS